MAELRGRPATLGCPCPMPRRLPPRSRAFATSTRRSPKRGCRWLLREHLCALSSTSCYPFHAFDGDFVGLRAYFQRLLTLLVSRFVVEDIATGDDGAYVRWRWEWKLRARSSRCGVVPGVTHLRFADDGRITLSSRPVRRGERLLRGAAGDWHRAALN